MIQPSLFLCRALLADAVVTGAVALLQTFGAGVLAPMLSLPQALVLETGLFLIAYTALVGWLGTRPSMPRALVAIVIAGNAAWALGSIALMFSGAVTPNLLGYAFIAVHAISTGVFAELQYIGVRKSSGECANENTAPTSNARSVRALPEPRASMPAEGAENNASPAGVG